jgi:hypothetical protein
VARGWNWICADAAPNKIRRAGYVSTALGNHICSSTGTGVLRDVNGGAVYWRWRGAINDFPSKVADDSIKGTPRDHVCIGVMETGVSQLSIRGGAG